MRMSTNAEEPLQITVPKVTKKILKIKAAQSGDTMRLIVLRTLANAVIQVPEEQVCDRRKTK